MATITPQPKASSDPALKRGPRRVSVVTTDEDGQGPDLEALRAALYGAIIAEHPGADLEPVGTQRELVISGQQEAAMAGSFPLKGWVPARGEAVGSAEQARKAAGCGI